MTTTPAAATGRYSLRPRWTAMGRRRRIALALVAAVAIVAGGIRAYHWWTGWPPRAILPDSGEDFPLAIAADGRSLVAVGRSGPSVWDARTARKREAWPSLSGRKMFHGDITADGRTFVGTSYDPSLRPSPLYLDVVDVTSGRRLTTDSVPIPQTGWLAQVLVDGGRRLRVLGLTSKTMDVVDFDVAEGRVSASRSLSKLYTNRAAMISPDGRFLPLAPTVGTSTTGSASDVILWDLDADREALRLAAPAGATWPDCFAFSPDGAILAVGRQDGSVEIWHLATRRSRRVGTHKSGFSARSLTFSPDGKSLVSVGDFRRPGLTFETISLHFAQITRSGNWRPPTEALLIDVASGGLLHRLPGEFRPVFSPDGRILATGDSDGSIRLRDLPRRREASASFGVTP